MPDEDDQAPGTTDQPSRVLAGDALVVSSTAEVTVHPAAAPPVPAWRRRAVAVRTALPQLARNPVVLGASAAAVTIAARVAVDAARRVVATPSATRPVAVTITAHVVHHVYVVHHNVSPAAQRSLPPSPPR